MKDTIGLNARSYNPAYDFEVTGVSYAGAARPGTAMFVTHKVAHLLLCLTDARDCLVFVDGDTFVDEAVRKHNCVVPCDDPEAEYGRLTLKLWQAERAAERGLKYTLTPGGYYLGEGVTLGSNVDIEPMVLIGHGVTIGDGCRIESGAKIYHTVMGQNCQIGSNSVIGNQSFFHYREEGRKMRLYQLGNVVLEDDVEVGANTTVNRSVAGSTILRRGAKLGDHVYIPHDVEVGENSLLVAHISPGGFVHFGRNVFVSLNVALRNRVDIGDNAVLGVGCVVTKDVPPGAVIIGNPGRVMK